MNQDPFTQSAEAVTETAKAFQEAAVVAQKGLDLADKSGSWVARMLGPVAEGLAGTLKDRTDLYRAKTFVKLHEKWEKFRTERGLGEGDWRDISPKLLLPALDSASLEDDDDLLDIWARLLATATDPNAPLVRRSYLEVAKQIEPPDARLLDFIYTLRRLRIYYDGLQQRKIAASLDELDHVIFNSTPPDNVYSRDLFAYTLADAHEPVAIRESVENLQRIGLLIDEGSQPRTIWRLNLIGVGFLNACYGSGGRGLPHLFRWQYHQPLRKYWGGEEYGRSSF